MRIEVIASKELGGDVLGEWAAIQESQPMLASPFFSPGFTAAVGSVRDNVRIAILRAGHEIVGLFPFQMIDPSSGHAIGEPVCDFQGIISAPDLGISAEALVAGCGLFRWSFTHLIALDDTFQSFRLSAFDSPFIDLTGGFARYRVERQQAGTQQLRQVERRRCQFEREIGQLCFEFDSGDVETLRATMRLKSEQYRRTGSYDRFAIGWIAALLERLLESRCADFGGMLSVLSTGGRLVAAHFGMRSRSVLNWWFPVYEVAFARYSPGLILLVEMMRAAEEAGLKRIDLGRGEAMYKRRFMTDASTVYSGCVALGPSTGPLRAT
jgi:CelD/BcsL family acetyltransferase involved in cellulose biosynthesis